MNDAGFMYKANDKSKNFKMVGSYEDCLLCLRGFLVAMSLKTGISVEKLLAVAVMMDKEEGIHYIERMDVVFRFSKGNTLVRTLTPVQMRGVQKVLGIRYHRGVLQYADEFVKGKR